MSKKPNFANRNKFLFQLYLSDTDVFEMFAKSFTFGGLTIGTQLVATPIRTYELPGTSRQTEDVVIDFYIDEDWDSYKQIFRWMQKIKNGRNTTQQYILAQAKLTILNTKFKEVFSIKLIDLFPYSLTTITFDTDDDTTPLMGQVVFKVNDMELAE